jgi:hypothetical protein
MTVCAVHKAASIAHNVLLRRSTDSYDQSKLPFPLIVCLFLSGLHK